MSSPMVASARQSPGVCVRRDKFIQHGGVIAAVLTLQRLSDGQHERACKHLIEGVFVAFAPESRGQLCAVRPAVGSWMC